MRFYGFGVKELTEPEQPNLDLRIDPKLAWALRHPEFFPVDLNVAPRDALLRVPGLGVRNVDRLIEARRWHKVRLSDLARLRVPIKKMTPFIATVDHWPKRADQFDLETRFTKPAEQLDLFPLSNDVGLSPEF
jgi:predicted DNA-binding helix-hairpin-helix protein